MHIVKTTEQLRVGYNSTNYFSTTVGATGIVTFNAVGAGSAFVFSDTVGFNGQALTGVASLANGGSGITIANGDDLTLYESLIFAGATGENKITIPDNLVSALGVYEGANKIIDIVTDDGNEFINLTYPLDMGDQGIYHCESIYSRDAASITINGKAGILFEYDSDTRLTIGDAYATFAKPFIVSANALFGSPVAGAVEFYNDRFYITNVGTQRAIDRTSDVIVATTTVANTTTETTIFTATIAAGDLKVGNIIKGRVSGILSNNSAADDITIRIKLAGVTIMTFNPAIGNVTDADWHMEGDFIIRTIGAAGTTAGHVHLVIDGHDNVLTALGSIDTTGSCDYTVTVEWNNAKADNTISIYNGFVEYKN